MNFRLVSVKCDSPAFDLHTSNDIRIHSEHSKKTVKPTGSASQVRKNTTNIQINTKKFIPFILI